MNRNETIRSTFAQDPKMTPGIIGIMRGIVKKSLTSFRDKKRASEKYYHILAKASEQRKD
jgi:hypothetical protein